MNKFRKIRRVLQLIFVATIFSSALLYGGRKAPTPQPKTMCFVVESNCPVAHLDLQLIQHAVIQGISGQLYFPVIGAMPVSGQITNVSKGLYIDGWEVNFGWWSKDSYRKYSVYDYLKEKYRREPTQAEINRVTEQELRDWFYEKHTVPRGLWADDPPYDIRTWEEFERKGPCTTLQPGNYVYSIKGSVTFPNGVKCDIIPAEYKDLYHSNASTALLKLKEPCNGCGLN